MNQLPCPCHNKIHDPGDRFEDMEIPPNLRRAPVEEAPKAPPPRPICDEPATEPTEQGLQFVIPGCEKDQARKRGQLELF